MSRLISPDGEHLFIVSLLLTSLIKFPPPCRVNLHGRIFLKRIKHWLVVLFLPMLIFFENDVFSEWRKRYFRRSKNQTFRCPNFLKLFLWILHFGGGIIVNFFRKGKKRKSYLNFSLYHYHRFSRISERKWEIVKSVVYHKSGVQLGSLFRPIVTNTSNSYQFRRIGSTCVPKVGCHFWTCITFPLNSNIGPANIRNHFCVSILMGLYTGGAHFRSFTAFDCFWRLLPTKLLISLRWHFVHWV